MNKLEKEELKKVNGGADLTSGMLSALIRGVATLFTIGQAVGSAIRRTINGNYC